MQEKIQKKSKEIRKVDWDFLYAFSVFFFQNSISSLFACFRDDKKKGVAVNDCL